MKNLGFVFLALLMTISSPFVAMGLPDDRELRENDLGAAEEAQRLNNEGALLAKQGSFLVLRFVFLVVVSLDSQVCNFWI